MSNSATLNLANYTTVWNDNFATDSNLNYTQFPVAWGYGNDFVFANGSLTLTSYASQGWAATGFMQAATGATAGQGYGLYSVTASANAGEGVGICAVMWPADNNWPGPEIDLLEDWNDPTRQTGYATIHWKGANNSNGQDIHQFTIDLTKPHTFAMDWEPGSLTYYIDGKEIFQVTGAEVPKDAAQGGVNEAFGAEVTAAGSAPISSSVSLHLYDMSYSAYKGTTTTTGGTTPPPTTTTGGTTATTIALSAPGSVQEPSLGAGVTVTETASAPGLTAIYEAVFTSANVAETGWTTVALDQSGNGSFSAHFAHSGDYVEAVNIPSAITVTGTSAPVTITEPTTTTGGTTTGGTTTPPATLPAAGPSNIILTGDNLYTNSTAWSLVGLLSATDSGSVQFALGDNASHLFSIDANKLLLNKNMPTPAAGSYQVGIIAVDATGQYTTQEIQVAVSTPTPTTGGTTTGGTTTGGTTTGGTTTGGATTPPATLPAAGPSNITLTGDNLYTNSTAWSLVGLLSATDSGSVQFALGDNASHLFSIDANKLLLNKNMPTPAAGSYQVGIIAVDAAGQYATQEIQVAVNAPGTAPAAAAGPAPAIPAAGITVTDAVGHSAALPVLVSGTHTYAASATGLSGAVSEIVSAGAHQITAAAGSGVTSVVISDAAGGSYQTDGFANVTATLAGASAGTLNLDAVTTASVSLGAGSYAVTAATVGATATAHFVFTSGNDSITLSGPGSATFAFAADLGAETITGFSMATDVLSIDHTLQASLHETAVAGGSTLLNFADASHSILLKGVAAFNTSAIHWA